MICSNESEHFAYAFTSALWIPSTYISMGDILFLLL